MARFQSAGRGPLFIVMSSSRARYGIMAVPSSFRISPEIPSGPTDLFFPIAPTLSTRIRRAQVKVGLINLCKGLFSLNARI